MAYDDTLIVDHIQKTHGTALLSEREKHLVCGDACSPQPGKAEA